jgi:hypothetical protein
MSKPDIYTVSRFLDRYKSRVELYLFNEDILKLVKKEPIDITEKELLWLTAFANMITDLEFIYDSNHLVCDFLTTKSDLHPFNGDSPMQFISRFPGRVLATSFFVMCLKTNVQNQYRLEYFE